MHRLISFVFMLLIASAIVFAANGNHHARAPDTAITMDNDLAVSPDATVTIVLLAENVNLVTLQAMNDTGQFTMLRQPVSSTIDGSFSVINVYEANMTTTPDARQSGEDNINVLVDGRQPDFNANAVNDAIAMTRFSDRSALIASPNTNNMPISVATDGVNGVRGHLTQKTPFLSVAFV